MRPGKIHPATPWNLRGYTPQLHGTIFFCNYQPTSLHFKYIVLMEKIPAWDVTRPINNGKNYQPSTGFLAGFHPSSTGTFPPKRRSGEGTSTPNLPEGLCTSTVVEYRLEGATVLLLNDRKRFRGDFGQQK